MSTIRSPVDEYGFKRPDDFDYENYDHFMSSYLRVLARRASRWKKFIRGSSKVKKSRKVKRFVRKGVPAEHRGQVWMDISGARKRKKRNPNYYKDLLKTDLDELVEHSITTDINRTFPENIHFGSMKQDLRKSLYNVLHVYALHNTSIGYCQGLNYITGLLILIVKNEESAFWLLDVLLSKRIPDYYAKDMIGLQVEQEVLLQLVKLKMPALHAHIESAGLPYSIFSTKWFICLFIDVLPIETVLRIWDSLFYEGSKILLRVSLTLLSLHETELMAAKDFAQLCTAMKTITQNPSTMDCHSFMTGEAGIVLTPPAPHINHLTLIAPYERVTVTHVITKFYNIAYYNFYNIALYNFYNIAHYNFYNIAHYNFYNIAHYNFYNIAHYNFYNIAHYNFYNIAHYNFYNIAHYNFYNIAHYNFYNIAHYNFYNIAHYNFYNIAHYTFCNIAHYNFYNIALYNFYNIAHYNFYNIAHYNFYNIAHYNFYNIAHYNFYNIAHYNFYNIAHYNFYNIAHYNFYNIALDFYNIAHYDFYNIAHYNFYNIAHYTFCNIAHYNFYNIAHYTCNIAHYNFYNIAHYNFYNIAQWWRAFLTI
ncbi:hypothetical protein QZH41_001812 [Actinostola sp. cb2023]|nr:hypothetical protein QZH41_001812 [Actinostola sp. cb2023]